MTEEPIYFGNGQLIGILTSPIAPIGEGRTLPRFVFLNAGLVHRVGPNRLYTTLARELARVGIPSVRVDLSGKGDSPAREGLERSQSLVLDHQDIVNGLEARFGQEPLILAGLCSGADDVVRLAPIDRRVVGMLLLDPICFQDAGFRRRTAILKYTNLARYVAWLKHRIDGPSARSQRELTVDPLTIREPATLEQLRAAFAALRERGGHVLSIFTGYAIPYYNQQGQLARVLATESSGDSCRELFWPDVEHTYTLDQHRRRLVNAVTQWVKAAFINGAQSDH